MTDVSSLHAYPGSLRQSAPTFLAVRCSPMCAAATRGPRFEADGVDSSRSSHPIVTDQFGKTEKDFPDWLKKTWRAHTQKKKSGKICMFNYTEFLSYPLVTVFRVRSFMFCI